MNKEKPLRDQAERLRKRIVKKEEVSHENEASASLPPRSRVHQQTKKKTKIKLKYPLIRMLALFFILLPLISFSIYTINENNKSKNVTPVSNDEENYETIDFEAETELETEREEFVTEEELTPVDIEDREKEPIAPTPNEKSTPDEKSIGTKDEVGVKEEKEQVIYHEVQRDDTLFSLAMKYYNSQSGIDIIKRANGIQNNEIQAGQSLKIPMN